MPVQGDPLSGRPEERSDVGVEGDAALMRPGVGGDRPGKGDPDVVLMAGAQRISYAAAVGGPGEHPGSSDIRQSNLSDFSRSGL